MLRWKKLVNGTQHPKSILRPPCNFQQNSLQPLFSVSPNALPKSFFPLISTILSFGPSASEGFSSAKQPRWSNHYIRRCSDRTSWTTSCIYSISSTEWICYECQEGRVSGSHLVPFCHKSCAKHRFSTN